SRLFPQRTEDIILVGSFLSESCPASRPPARGLSVQHNGGVVMHRRIAINGFGRIGRLTFRSIFERNSDSLDIVAINDPAGTHTDSLLLEFDSNYGRFRGDVVSHDGHLHVNDKLVRVLRDREWSSLPWGELGVHTVLECSGQGVSREKAEKHLQAGARQVIISAPGKGDDVTI